MCLGAQSEALLAEPCNGVAVVVQGSALHCGRVGDSELGKASLGEGLRPRFGDLLLVANTFVKGFARQSLAGAASVTRDLLGDSFLKGLRQNEEQDKNVEIDSKPQIATRSLI